jgi:hypothetical protein
MSLAGRVRHTGESPALPTEAAPDLGGYLQGTILTESLPSIGTSSKVWPFR